MAEPAEHVSTAPDDLPFEEDVMRRPFDVLAWVRYLEFKAKARPRDRFRIYERALHRLPGSYKLWKAYLDEVAHRCELRPVTHRVYTAANNTFERALVFMHKMPRIWLDYAAFLERQMRRTATRHVYDRALQALPATQHQLVWAKYIDFVESVGIPDVAVRVYRRYLKLDPSQCERFIAYLKGVRRFGEACRWIVQVVNDHKYVSERGVNRHELWLDLCEMASRHPDQVAALDVDAIIRSGVAKFTDEVGRLWTSLAEFHARQGHFSRARDTYEEALDSVTTVRDFSLVYDAYAKFEEGLITARMEDLEEADADADADAADASGLPAFDAELDLDMLMERLERLTERRPVILNGVLLRQNPHDVPEWMRRAKLMEADVERAVATFREAVDAVDPVQAIGRVGTLWTAYARYLEEHGRVDDARRVFDEAVGARFKDVPDLAGVYCNWAEMELRADEFDRARAVMARACTPPRLQPGEALDDLWGDQVPPRRRVFRSVRAWALHLDLEESVGTVESARAAYDRAFELKVATPKIVLNYGAFLEEHKFFEASFQVYERGVALFSHPHVLPIWKTYLQRFVARFGGSKLERARDLFDQSLVGCPPESARDLYLQYANLEEAHGLRRNAMSVYQRAVKHLLGADRFDVYLLYIKRASEYFGVVHSRQLYEEAIEVCEDKYARQLCVQYAELERKLGEVDRARAVFGHGAQFANPSAEPEYWDTWRKFEVAHGNEETFREMLRIKRTVATSFSSQVNISHALYVAASDQQQPPSDVPQPPADAPPQASGDEAKVDQMAALEAAAEAAQQQAADAGARTISFASGETLVQQATSADANEISLSDDDSEESEPNPRKRGIDQVAEKAVPAAVFGGLDVLAAKRARTDTASDEKV